MTTPFDDHELAELRRVLEAMEAQAPETPLDLPGVTARPFWVRRPALVAAAAAVLTMALLLPVTLWLRGPAGPAEETGTPMVPVDTTLGGPASQSSASDPAAATTAQVAPSTPATTQQGSTASTTIVASGGRDTTAAALYLDRIAVDLVWVRNAVVDVNASWDARETSFAETEIYFGRLLTVTNSYFGTYHPEIPQEISVGLDDGEVERLGELLQDVADLRFITDKIDRGLKAADDGTLRREAVSEFVETVDLLLGRVDGLRASLGPTDLTVALPTLLTAPDSNPLLTPYDALPSCGDPNGLIGWAGSSFAGWAGEAGKVRPTEAAVWVPLPMGIAADCATAVASDTHVAWELRSADDELLARAAGSFGRVMYLTPCNDPSRVFEQGDWYGQIGSGHSFRVCMTENHLYGTPGALVDKRWPIFEIELASSIRPTETRWPGGWLGTDGFDDNRLQPTAERLLLSRSDEIVQVGAEETRPAEWPEGTFPCSRFRASLGDPMAEPTGSPSVDVIELCDAAGAAYWYVRSGVSLAPAYAEVMPTEGREALVWTTDTGGWAAELTVTNIAGEFPQIRSLRPDGDLTAVLASLATLPVR